MLERLGTIRMAKALSAYAAGRMKLIAGNVANADTPGYRARDVRPFSEVYGRGDDNWMRTTRPVHLGHRKGAAPGLQPVEERGGMSPNGNSVSLEREMVRSAEVKRQHELSLSVYQSSLNMLRSALGRRG